ncbi:MAG TPA: hypothetical protein D7H81_03385 [Candidatus Poseidoniales archaeon]|nr:MAG TPA: hypothetical protein D7H81_03385 [Candidatus Poseidoniales archaeon]
MAVKNFADSPVGEQPIFAVRHKIRLSPNDLDTSFNCKRGYWISEVKGWLPTMLKIRDLEFSNQTTEDLYCEPKLFGLLMHRLLELGLENPFEKNQPPVLPLPKTFENKNTNDLLDPKLVEDVLLEEGISLSAEGFDKTRAVMMKERLIHLAKLVNQGLIGKFSLGQTYHNRTPEGLRTELPFFFKHKIDLNETYRLGFTIHGFKKLAEVTGVEVSFDGRADLVLAFRDANERGLLQVVDLKTTGCRGDFNQDNPNEGSALQVIQGDPLSKYPQTSAEEKILRKHKLQLTLYSLALEAIESDKPEPERREILPPAILIAASGRCVELTKEEFETTKRDLLLHLEWIAKLSAEPSVVEEPNSCSASDGQQCFTCNAIDSIIETEINSISDQR